MFQNNLIRKPLSVKAGWKQPPICRTEWKIWKIGSWAQKSIYTLLLIIWKLIRAIARRTLLMIERGEVKRKPETNLSYGGAGVRGHRGKEARMSLFGLGSSIGSSWQQGIGNKGKPMTSEWCLITNTRSAIIFAEIPTVSVAVIWALFRAKSICFTFKSKATINYVNCRFKIFISIIPNYSNEVFSRFFG